MGIARARSSDRRGPVSAIGRPVDPRYATNKWILIVSASIVVAGAVLRWARGDGLGDAAIWGGKTGAGAFLAWALARELDPDHPYGAFVAAGLAAIGAVAYGPSPLLFSFGALLMLRFVNRTIGPPATWLDGAVGTGVALFLVHGGAWPAGILMATAFVLDAVVRAPNRRQAIWAAVTLAGTLWLTPLPPQVDEGALDPAWIAALAGAAVAMAYAASQTRSLRSLTDRGGRPLDPRRVQAAQGLSVAAGFAMIALLGETGWDATRTLLAAMMGVGAYRVALRFRPAPPAQP